MATRTVDLVATGPPSSDPYAPGATAWGLAAALARSGSDVLVLYPKTGDPGTLPDGVRGAAVELPMRRPGAAVESAELASAAGRRVRRQSDLVVRDPIGLGALGLPRPSGGGPVIASFVRGVELVDFERDHPEGSAGFRDRLDRWRDRRAIRRLEEAALKESDRLFYDGPEIPRLLAEAYDVPESRCRPALPAVPSLPAPGSVEDARASFRIPADVPVVAAPAAFDTPDPSGIPLAREAFRRVRSFFPGARLIVTGTTAPAEPHVTVAPERDGATLARAIVAADVVVFDRRSPGFDPGAILAMRAGRAVIVGPGVRLPEEPGEAARAIPSDDPGELASVLAELLADPAARRPLLAAATTYAAGFEPEHIAETVLDGVAIPAQ
jgi:hypothetical protein